MVALEDIPAGVEELKRCAQKGLRGVLIWGSPPEDKPYSHQDYDPFWAAAQDLTRPLSLHILTGRRGTGVSFDLSNILNSYMRLPQEIQLTLADMAFGGVFERFPRLKIVSAENDVSWIPHFMYRIDHAYDRRRHFQGVNLKMMPSEYIKRQVWATFQFEDVWIDLRKRYAPDKLMWSSDYPHTDSPWPRSRQWIEEHFTGVPESELVQVVGGNVANLYGIG